MLRTLLFLLLFCPVLAGSAHITDRLLAGMYVSANKQQEPIQLLPSGTPVELIGEKDGFVKVQLVDGKTGWVEKRFLSNDKPAKVRLLALQSKYRQLQAKLDAAEQRLIDSTKALLDLKEEASAAELVASEKLGESLANAEAEIIALQQPLTKPSVVEEKTNKERTSSYSVALLGALLFIGIGLGLFIGMRLQDQRQLKRHGGFRV